MAPILATSTGVTPQVLCDPDLIQLLISLKALALVESEAGLKELADLLEPWKGEWLFEETVRIVQRFWCFLCSSGIFRAFLVSFTRARVVILFSCIVSMTQPTFRRAFLLKASWTLD